MSRWSRGRKLGLAGAFAAAAAVAYLASQPLCLSAYLFQGVRATSCPDGRFRQVVSASVNDAQRGGVAHLSVRPFAHYADGAGERDTTGEVVRFTARASLRDAQGKETPLELTKPWTSSRWGQFAEVKFPAVPDGDYRVHFTVDSALGKGEADVPLALYAPARVHVLTDRPLYQAGDLVKFRAVVLRARDLVPLDGRPGHWELRDPNGELLLEERAPAGAWGVVAGTFPLDRGAPHGDWRLAWVSGDARDEVSFRVQPFVLPRFHIEAAADASYYRAHAKPVVKGRVVYSSGAPVAGARIEVSWEVSGAWPPPSGWLEHDVPRQATTDRNGDFTLTLPAIPGDLQGTATLAAHLAATDASGDRVEGGTALLLSEDALAVGTVTELADGLVEGFNNRLFLRATRPSGEVLRNTELEVKRAWDPEDPGIRTTTDEDGVAQLQLDPGPAVNIVIPPAPFRPQPAPEAVELQDATDMLGGEISLAERKALEDAVPRAAPCVRFASDGAQAQVALELDASGNVRGHAQTEGALGRCAADALRGLRAPVHEARIYGLQLAFSDSALPRAAVGIRAFEEQPPGLEAVLKNAVANARPCLPKVSGESFTERATWHVAAGQKALSLAWITTGAASTTERAAVACLQARTAGLAMEEPAKRDGVGVAEVTVSGSTNSEAGRPEATTMLGYELQVRALEKGHELGLTRVRIAPGRVPPLRLRASPVLAEAGGMVDVELLRGPEFSGELPEKVWLRTDDGKPVEAKVDREARTARLKVPDAAKGWVTIDAGQVRTLVYVRSKADLAVAVQPEHERYAPGQKARLAIQTSIGGRGAPAAVGLFGVDESLAQLAPLLGPEAFSRIRPKATMSSPAFGALDAEALSLGRIRGSNAAVATVLRVSGVPSIQALDGIFRGASAESFNPEAELTDHFYEVLGELHGQARLWEEKAGAKEKMHPATMAELWKKALAAVKAHGGKTDDAYGRDLRLSNLPGDLLALTDPRAVIVNGAHLPEDVENWAAWVAKEKP